MGNIKSFSIDWDTAALHQLESILEHLERESAFAVKIVMHAILHRVSKIENTPFINEVDKLKTNNDGTYRAFVAYSYRVSYRVLYEKILVVILRVRHTSREPLEH